MRQKLKHWHDEGIEEHPERQVPFLVDGQSSQEEEEHGQQVVSWVLGRISLSEERLLRSADWEKGHCESLDPEWGEEVVQTLVLKAQQEVSLEEHWTF